MATNQIFQKMKQLFCVIVVLIMCSQVNAQTLEETSDYLEYIIEENPPFENMSSKFKLVNTAETDRFMYVLQRLENGKVMNTLTYLIFFSDIKSISLKQVKVDNKEKYVLTLNLGKDPDLKSYLIGFKGGLETEYIDDVFITLSDDEILAKKSKKAMIHLFKLMDIEVVDLDLF